MRANEMFVIKRVTDKLPFLGALNYLHDVALRHIPRSLRASGPSFRTIRPRICSLSVWASATSNDTLRMLGGRKMTLNRLLFDREASSRGIENYITAREAGLLLKRFVSTAGCFRPCQRRCFRSWRPTPQWEDSVPAAAQREDRAQKQVRTMALPMTWASYTRGSRLLCFCGEHVSPPEFERAMQDINPNAVWKCGANSLKILHNRKGKTCNRMRCLV